MTDNTGMKIYDGYNPEKTLLVVDITKWHKGAITDYCDDCAYNRPSFKCHMCIGRPESVLLDDDVHYLRPPECKKLEVWPEALTAKKSVTKQELRQQHRELVRKILCVELGEEGRSWDQEELEEWILTALGKELENMVSEGMVHYDEETATYVASDGDEVIDRTDNNKRKVKTMDYLSKEMERLKSDRLEADDALKHRTVRMFDLEQRHNMKLSEITRLEEQIESDRKLILSMEEHGSALEKEVEILRISDAALTTINAVLVMYKETSNKPKEEQNKR